MSSHTALNNTHRAVYAHLGALLAVLIAATLLIVGHQRQLRQGIKLLGNFREHLDLLFSPESCAVSALMIIGLFVAQSFWRVFVPFTHAQIAHR